MSTAADPLYLQLSDRLAAAIRRGTLAPGERLPSVRQCAREQGLNLPMLR